MIVSYGGNILSFNGSILSYQTPTSPPVSSNLRLLILGDTSVSTVVTNIRSQLSILGYSGSSTVSGITMGTTYSASGLTPSDYNCVLYYTNASQIGSTSLTSNLLNYRNLGGNIVTGVFTWNLRPVGWSDSNVTNFVGAGVNQTNNLSNINIIVNHQIFSGVSSAITNNNLYFTDDVTTTQSGSTTLATLASNGRPFLAIRTVGSSRLVSVNTFPPGVSSYANMRRLYTNAVLWAVGLI